jgi:hypothetical protein
VQQFLALFGFGDLLHPLGHRAMGDDFRAFEELIAPNVVGVFMRVDDTLRHGRPDLAEHLDHLAGVCQVRLGVDHHAAAHIDESGIGVANPVLLVNHRKAMIADLMHFHEDRLHSVIGVR